MWDSVLVGQDVDARAELQAIDVSPVFTGIVVVEFVEELKPVVARQWSRSEGAVLLVTLTSP